MKFKMIVKKHTVRLIIKILLLIGSFFAFEMYLSILKPSRYHLFSINRPFITLYTIGIIIVVVITVIQKDYMKHNIKRLLLWKILLFIVLVILICNSIVLTLFIPVVFKTYEELVAYNPYHDNEAFQKVYIFFNYILVMLETVYIYIITRYLPACILKK